MKSLLFSGFLIPLAAGCMALGCAVDGVGDEDDGASSSEVVESRKLPIDRLLEDSDILGGSAITTSDVQKFLDDKGSFLATYKEEGKLAAAIIVDRCREKGVSPVYMLARIQGESSLVESKSPKESLIEKATGCGCPDGKGCSAEFQGFANQITCAANLISKYFTQMESDGKTVSGWAVGTEKKTLDPCTVTPKNKATAALYTYTPWVGAQGDGCGSSKWAGSSGMASLTLKYKEAFGGSKTSGNGGTTGPEVPFCQTAAGKADPICQETTTPTPGGCQAMTAEIACDAAFRSRNAECGIVSDGCGGQVNCDTVPRFGCGGNESCISNRCSTGSCVPRPTGELCNAARASQGVECGMISDGCGSSVNCDVVATFGCATGKTCGADHKCKAQSTTPPPADPPKVEDPPSSPTGGDDTSSTSTTGGDDDDGDKSGGDDKPETTKSNQKKPKKKKIEGGCSAAPGSSGGSSSALAGLGLVFAFGALRRRRSSRAS